MRCLFAILLTLSIACADENRHDATDSSMRVFIEILRLSLESNELLPYVMESSDKDDSPLCVVYSEEFWREPYPNVEIMGTPVTFMHKSEADSIGMISYFWITEYIAVDTTARLMLSNPSSNMSFGIFCEKINDEWVVQSTFVDSLD